METFLAILLVIGILILVLGLDFIISAGLVYGICWAFGLVFSWKITFGVWLVLLLISGYVKTTVNK